MNSILKTAMMVILLAPGAQADDLAGRWGGGAALFFGWVRGASRRIWVDDSRVIAYEYSLFRAVIPLDDEGEL